MAAEGDQIAEGRWQATTGGRGPYRATASLDDCTEDEYVASQTSTHGQHRFVYGPQLSAGFEASISPVQRKPQGVVEFGA